MKKLASFLQSFQQNEAGFTLTELIITVGIISLLLSTVAISLTTSHRKASVSSAITQVITDFKLQQVKAMSGDTEGGATATNYGIYFNATSYVLFRGTSYNPNDTNNLAVPIENTLQFSPVGKTVIFTKASGDVSSFDPLANTITISDTTSNVQKVVTFNKYGVVTSVN